MALKYVTAQEIRDACGVDSTLKTDAEIERAGESAENRLESHYGTAFSPTMAFESLDGNGKSSIRLGRNPVLQVRYVSSNDTEIKPNNLEVSEGSGIVYTARTSSVARFIKKRRSVNTEYTYGWVEPVRSDSAPYGNVQTTMTVAKTLTNDVIEDSVTLTVADSSIFSVNDHVRLWGRDGNRETATITAIPDATSITVDFVTLNHAIGSYVTKVDAPEWFKELVTIVAGIKVVANIVGSQFDEITGYELGDLRVQKGEPYTQWRETIIRLVNQRDEILKSKQPRPYVA